MISYTPLHDPEKDATHWTPPLDMALAGARKALARHEGANIHDRDAMIRAATGLEMVLRDVLAALDKETGR